MKKFLFGLLAAIFFLVPASKAFASGGYYICEDGESIATIANSYALDADLLALINNVATDMALTSGDLLRLPQNPCYTIEVQPGDTLFALAREYDVTVAEILELNSLGSSARIYPGDELLLPLKEEVAATSASSKEVANRVAVFASRGGVLAYSWPTIGVISSAYGERWNAFHYGLDIAADENSEIYAAAAGLITESGWKNDAYGYAVMIDHGNGQETLYGHCSSVVAKVGTWVEQGQLIAYVGSTGNSTGNHLHFEVRVDGSCMDPQQYLP